ncbi:MAG: hypothetical protein ACREYE_03390, partial [Gammaproteobacteria bacterium]
MGSLMPNTSVAIKLQPAERTQLETWGSAHRTPQQVALRCRIIVSFRQVCGGAVRSSLAEIPVRLSRRRIRARTVRERTAIWP